MGMGMGMGMCGAGSEEWSQGKWQEAFGSHRVGRCANISCAPGNHFCLMPMLPTTSYISVHTRVHVNTGYIELCWEFVESGVVRGAGGVCRRKFVPVRVSVLNCIWSDFKRKKCPSDSSGSTSILYVHVYICISSTHPYGAQRLEYAEKLGAGSKKKVRKTREQKNEEFHIKITNRPRTGANSLSEKCGWWTSPAGDLSSRPHYRCSARPKVPEVVNSAWQCD